MTQHAKDIWMEQGVEVTADVDSARIADDAAICRGCRISGKETSIGPGCVIGAEGPVVLENCQLGHNVELKGGYFSGATFLDGACVGSGAHVRPGTLLEEEARAAHTVGLKQTVLMPYVTLGSLINFCDVLMAGGTGAANFSEVGSSYIHFNYTPHQDKATASLLGDVPRGVFLDQAPVFMGGQGGLLGPSRMAYGTVVAAGSICRQDVLEENQLHIPTAPEPATRPYDTGIYRRIGRIVENNLVFIGNVFAMKAWYRHVRGIFMCRDSFDRACHAGAMHNLDRMLTERIRRLGGFAQKVQISVERLEAMPDASEVTLAEQRRFLAEWDNMEFQLKQADWMENTKAKETFLAATESIPVGGSFPEIIQGIAPEARMAGQEWLQSIVNDVAGLWTTS